MSDEARLPTDEYSRDLARLKGHPDAFETTSTTERADFYGNHEAWVVKTIRINGEATVFMIRTSASGQLRMVIPPDITAVIARQRDTITDKSRRRGAIKAAATREALGIKPNVDALAKARKARAEKKGKAK